MVDFNACHNSKLLRKQDSRDFRQKLDRMINWVHLFYSPPTWVASRTWAKWERYLQIAGKIYLHEFTWYLHGLGFRIRCVFDSYDDLLLPDSRLLAQLPVFVSGEHFKNTI